MPSESIDYLHEKFRSGVESLDEWPGLPPRERLLNAYTGQVYLADRPGDDVPAALRQRIAQLHADMRAVPDPSEGHFGTFATTVDAMTEETATALTAEIRAIEARLRALRGR